MSDKNDNKPEAKVDVIADILDGFLVRQQLIDETYINAKNGTRDADTKDMLEKSINNMKQARQELARVIEKVNAESAGEMKNDIADKVRGSLKDETTRGGNGK